MLRRNFRFRQTIVVFLVATFLSIVALGSIVLLGQLYIKILIKGQANEPKAGDKEVVSNINEKKIPSQNNIKLETTNVYLLQAGVFSEKISAQKSAEQLSKAGFAAVPSGQSPYRIYIGIYLDKEAALKTKKDLEDQNISTYVNTAVINSNMPWTDIKDLKSSGEVLQKFNQWLKINLAIFAPVKFESIQGNPDKELGEAENVGGELDKAFAGVKELPEWYKNLSQYQKKVSLLKKEWSGENYRQAKIKLIEGITEYINWNQQIIDKK